MQSSQHAPPPRFFDLRAAPWFELLDDDGTLCSGAPAFDDGGWTQHLQPGATLNHRQPLPLQVPA